MEDRWWILGGFLGLLILQELNVIMIYIYRVRGCSSTVSGVGNILVVRRLFVSVYLSDRGRDGFFRKMVVIMIGHDRSF